MDNLKLVSDWIDIFPIDETLDVYGARETRMFPFRWIVSPVHLAAFEQLRAEDSQSFQSAEGVPCDIFLWRQAKSDRRDGTRIGGLPYRPSGQAWPDFEGEPFAFIGQIDFSLSKDLVPEIPGDILLYFMLESTWSNVHIEWQKKTAEPMAASEECHLPNQQILECEGHRFRTFDYPNLISEIGDPSICIANATKIGGIVPLSEFRSWSGDFEELEDEYEAEYIQQKQKHIATLSSIVCDCNFDWPFIDSRPKLSVSEALRPENKIVFGDLGCLHTAYVSDSEMECWFG